MLTWIVEDETDYIILFSWNQMKIMECEKTVVIETVPDIAQNLWCNDSRILYLKRVEVIWQMHTDFLQEASHNISNATMQTRCG